MKEEGQYDVLLTNGDIIFDVSHVVQCIGRKPNISKLGLDKVNVKVNERGAIITDEFEETSVPNIFAIGDVTDKI